MPFDFHVSVYVMCTLAAVAAWALTEWSACALADLGDGSRYRDFVHAHLKKLDAEQTVRLGGDLDGTPFIVTANSPARAWTSVGSWMGDKYQRLPIPPTPFDEHPSVCDFQIWPVLEKLQRRQDDAPIAAQLDAMGKAFAEWGFESASGLLNAGSMSRFDVVEKRGVGTSVWDTPSFKPGGEPEMDYLLRYAREKTLRFCRSTYIGLVTRPDTMDFNRYVAMGYDDSRVEPVLEFNPWHRGFLLTGVKLITYWLVLHLHGGEERGLQWAEQMAAKLAGDQHAASGLLPHFYGAIHPDQKDQPPTPYANINDAQTAVMFIEAAAMIRNALTDEGASGDANQTRLDTLATTLDDMGRRFLIGLATFGYDAEGKRFRTWIRMDGVEWDGEAFYTFRTQADKDAALARDPEVEDIEVYPGPQFFANPQSNLNCGTGIPLSLATGAVKTGDATLLEHAVATMEDAVAAAGKITGAFNDRDQMVFTGMANYMRGSMQLYQSTGESRWLDAAVGMADSQLAALSDEPRIEGQPWWKLPGRSLFFETLLDLQAAVNDRSA